VIPPDDLKLYELFVRYWDNTLSPDDAGELERRLAADPQAREWFHLFTLQAVAAADMPAAAPEPTPDPAPSHDLATAPLSHSLPAAATPVPDARRRVSRRQMFRYAGGLAAGLGGASFGWWLWDRDPVATPRLRNLQGTVVVQNAEGRVVPPDHPVPPGGTVTTYGHSSSVVLAYPDGSAVTLTGDSAVRVADRDRRVMLRRGVVSVAIPPQPVGADQLALLTSQVTFAGLSGVLMTLGEGQRATEALVHQGTATASHPTGEPIAVVWEGESLTVWRDGDHKKRPIAPTPEEYAWDLAQPLAEGWPVGLRGVDADGTPYARPEYWPDPYYKNTEMYQIRSTKQWLHGFFQATPESVVRVKYRVDTPGKGQVCFCVRTPQTRSPDTGMLEWNGVYGEAGAGQWHWLNVEVADMLDNKHAPKFSSPWIGFLFIFNTYTEDLGLKIAELRVSRPGADPRL
jgi:ferric-dicitrate binding protein FerR (iron transport regulator)